MWENASPPTPQTPPPQGGHRQPAGEDLLTWGQILLCLLALGMVLAGKMLALPYYPALRTAFEAAMQPEQELFLSEQRNFAKFAEESVTAAARAVQQLLEGEQAALPTAATPESAARPAHHQPESIPSGCRAESYSPNFALLFPLPGGVCEKTSGYGWRTDPMGGDGTDYHTGADLAVAQGTPVLAAAGGVVRVAGSHKSYGNYIRILHADGDETLYAHLQYLFVHTGQQVAAGQTLGTVGQTGNATGPHLHFELLHKGVRYDPSKALQGAGTAAP